MTTRADVFFSSSRRGARTWIGALLVAVLVALSVPFAPGAGAAGPDFAILVSPSTQTLKPGGTAVFLVEVTPIEGFDQPVTLSVSGLPEGVSATFSNGGVINPPGTSFLTLTATTSAPLTTAPIEIIGTSGALTHSTDATAVVDFALVPKCLVDVQGTVREGGPTGPPVAGALANVGGKTATTDESGSFKVTGVELGDNNSPITRNVTITKNPPALNRIGDYWTSSVPTLLVCERTATVDVSLTKVVPSMMKGVVLEGKLAADGTTIEPVSPATPVAGASVRIAGAANVTSKADGTYEFVDDQGRTGFHVGDQNTSINGNITVLSPTSQPARHRYWPTAFDVGTITAGADITAPTVLMVRQCTASVSGKVTDEKGTPLVNVSVRVSSLNDLDFINARTGADGTYTVPELLVGENNVPSPITARATGNFPTTSVTTPGPVACGQSPVLDIVVETEEDPDPSEDWLYGSITGRVLDEDTNDPVAGAQVSFSCTKVKPTDCPPATTASDGSYTIANVPVGTTQDAELNALVAAALEPQYHPGNASVKVKPGEPTAAPDIKLLKRRFGAVEGRVTNAAGEPISGVRIATRANSSCGNNCTTDSDGRYSITGVTLGTRNAPVDSSVTATLDGHWPKSVNVRFEPDVTKTVDFTLVKVCAGGTVEGTVYNASTREPLAGVEVRTSGVASKVTDDEGRYKIEGIPVGTDNAPKVVTLVASKEGFYTQSLSVRIECDSSVTLNFGARPNVTGLEPDHGPATGGTEVIITGANLAGVTAVTFGGVPATSFEEISPTELKAISPAHEPGEVDVVVTTPGGMSEATSESRFTYDAPEAPAPTVTGLDPDNGPTEGGTEVTITGTDLTGVTEVTFGDTPATSFTFVSPTEVRATAPPHAAGTVDVVVTTPGGDSAPSAASRFTYVDPQAPAPTVTGLDPDNGPTEGGTEVTITGTDLTGVTEVTFGDTPATSFEEISPTQLKATSPAHDAGEVDVVVTTAGGSSPTGSASKFLYEEPAVPAPTVTGIDPDSGSTDGGETVTITGTNLTGVTSVTFGGKAATSVTQVSPTQVTATTPAHAPGTVDVIVTTSAGSSAPSAAAKFTYDSPPTCPSIPSSVNAELTTVDGRTVKVGLSRLPLPFGLIGPWLGAVDYSDAGAGGSVRALGIVLAAGDAVTAIPGSCGAVRVRVDVIDFGRWPWTTGPMDLQLIPGNGEPTRVAVNVSGTSVPPTAATGQLTIT